jgi:hypothetical protein
MPVSTEGRTRRSTGLAGKGARLPVNSPLGFIATKMSSTFNLRFLVCSLFVLVLVLECAAGNASKTIIRDQAAAEKLKGDHFFALQWISWDCYGRVSVTTNQGVWEIKGRQDSRENDDFISIEGVITEINTLNFGFSGTIITKVSHINNGHPVTRSGVMTFRISGKRQYWRLKEMQNPADEATDYIDVFFKKLAPVNSV